jgi:hypothetical protein
LYIVRSERDSDETGKTGAPCHSRCGTIKTPSCLKAPRIGLNFAALQRHVGFHISGKFLSGTKDNKKFPLYFLSIFVMVLISNVYLLTYINTDKVGYKVFIYILYKVYSGFYNPELLSRLFLHYNTTSLDLGKHCKRTEIEQTSVQTLTRISASQGRSILRDVFVYMRN